MKLYSCKVLIFYTKGYNAKEDWKKFRTYIVILMSTRLTQNSTKSCSYAKSLQSCLTLCNPIDGSPSGSPVPGILQARTLEWVAISFSNAWKWKVKVKLLSRVRLCATPWTAAHQAPPSVGFSRQEYWSGVPFPSLDIWHSLYNSFKISIA